MKPSARETIDGLLGSVESIMQAHTVVLRPDETLEEAARKLEKAGVSGGPVMSGGEVIGMVSLSDLFEAAGVPFAKAATSGPWHRYEHSLGQSEKKVKDVMSHQVVSVQPAAPIAEAASLMRSYRINRLPVVDRTGTLHGIVARDDIIEAVARVAHELHSARSSPSTPALGPTEGRQR